MARVRILARKGGKRLRWCPNPSEFAGTTSGPEACPRGRLEVVDESGKVLEAEDLWTGYEVDNAKGRFVATGSMNYPE